MYDYALYRTDTGFQYIFKFYQLTAMKMIRYVWNNIYTENIQNFWMHTRILAGAYFGETSNIQERHTTT